VFAVLAAIGLVVVALSRSSARRSEPFAGRLLLESASETRGRTVFAASCHACHPGGMGGLGPALNDKPLPGWLMAFQVRHGLGAMPAFDEAHLPEADLDALLDYLLALRRHGPPRFDP